MSPASSSYGSTISGGRVRRAMEIVLLSIVALMVAALTGGAIMSGSSYLVVAVGGGLFGVCVAAVRGVRHG